MHICCYIAAACDCATAGGSGGAAPDEVEPGHPHCAGTRSSCFTQTTGGCAAPTSVGLEGCHTPPSDGGGSGAHGARRSGRDPSRM